MRYGRMRGKDYPPTEVPEVTTEELETILLTLTDPIGEGDSLTSAKRQTVARGLRDIYIQRAFGPSHVGYAGSILGLMRESNSPYMMDAELGKGQRGSDKAVLASLAKRRLGQSSRIMHFGGWGITPEEGDRTVRKAVDAMSSRPPELTPSFEQFRILMILAASSTRTTRTRCVCLGKNSS